MTPTVGIRCVVNGKTIEDSVEPRTSLVDYLRHGVGLTGTHVGCEQGVCGMCTVLVDGVAAKSCLMLAPQADGHEIRTIESVAPGEELHPLQEALRDHHGLQCGYCTPGFVMTALALKDSGAACDEATLRAELSGNLCRCTGYQNIVTAVAEFLGVEEHPA
ncbi:MAG: (2Fe-2S)-binding protein [Acidimicrobiia bacterium]|nr:(2Fe-2S)-binding protein [Acidimicrobiia bacterium]